MLRARLRIEIYPSAIELPSSRSRCQLIVTGFYAGGRTRDLTHAARYVSSDADIVGIQNAVAVPKKNGAAAIRVEAAGQSLLAPVRVTGMEKPDPIRFHYETLAILTRQGCNAGSCHGAAEGKGGFALSLFAYAPQLDEEAFVRGGLNRRINLIDPEDSLLLKKPTLRIPHQGGKRLSRSDDAYPILRDWIAQGTRADVSHAPVCTRIVIHPSTAQVLQLPQGTQQLAVMAHFSDGSVRDVTMLATYSSSNSGTLSVDAAGLVTGSDAATRRLPSAISNAWSRFISPWWRIGRDISGPTSPKTILSTSWWMPGFDCFKSCPPKRAATPCFCVDSISI